MTALMRIYDSSAIDVTLLTILVSCGYADLAMVLADNDAASHITPAQAAAAKAAGGQWREAVASAVGEHKRSMFYPGYAP